MKTRKRTALACFAGSLLVTVLWADIPADLNLDNWLSVGGNTSVSGTGTAAFGENNIVSGTGSVAFGKDNSVSSTGNAAFGMTNTVSGSNAGSVAIGVSNMVSGLTNFATGTMNSVGSPAARASALGAFLNSTSSHGTVVGYCNKEGSNMAGFRLRFSVGNGTGAAANQRRNAFEVHESGDVTVPSDQLGGGGTPRFEVLANGDVIVGKAQGDISMGEFE